MNLIHMKQHLCFSIDTRLGVGERCTYTLALRDSIQLAMNSFDLAAQWYIFHFDRVIVGDSLI